MHWSSFSTSKAWIKEILVVYRDRMIKKHDLNVNSKMILHLDCWTVHRSIEFRDWMAKTNPRLILLFVPASCTGLFQPCDVGVQRLFKHSVKLSASRFFVEWV